MNVVNVMNVIWEGTIAEGGYLLVNRRPEYLPIR